MEDMNKINKVRILEKNFPAGIPADFYGNPQGTSDYIISNCGEKQIEIVNESGETIGLFYGGVFMLPYSRNNHQQFISDYDKIIDALESFDVLDEDAGADWDYQDDEVRNEEVCNYDYYRNHMFGWTCIDFALSTCCRLRYPYKLSDDNFRSYKNFLLEYLPSGNFCLMLFCDPAGREFEVIRWKIPYLINLVGEINIPEISIKMIEGMFEASNNLLYDYFSISLTKDNIDYWIEIANSTGKTVLLAFLLDHKNKHFPADGTAAPTL